MTNARDYRILLLVVCMACVGPAGADDPRAGSTGQPQTRDRADRRQPDAVAVNPFTGNDLGVERKQVELERARLDEQIAAAELNRRKYQLEMQRLGSPSDVPGAAYAPSAAWTLPPVLPASGGTIDGQDVRALVERGGTARPVSSAGANHPAGRRKSTSMAAAAASKGQADIALVAVVESGGTRRAVFSANGQYIRATAGDFVLGRRLESVDAKSAILAGQMLTLRDDVPTVAGVDRKPERPRASESLPPGRADLSAGVPFADSALRPQDSAAGLAGIVPPLTR